MDPSRKSPLAQGGQLIGVMTSGGSANAAVNVTLFRSIGHRLVLGHHAIRCFYHGTCVAVGGWHRDGRSLMARPS